MSTIINVLGAGRSGSTILGLMLGNDDSSFFTGEIHAWFRPFRTHHFKFECSCGNFDCETWKNLKGLKENVFHENVLKALGVNYVVDSSKNLNWCIDIHSWYKNKNISIINFIIYKELINYIYSLWKRGETIDSAIKKYLTYYKRFFQTNLSGIAIKYEELISNTDLILDRVIEYTGQKKTLNREQFWLKQHHYTFGSGGVLKQIKDGNSEIKPDLFDDAFERLIPELKARIDADKEIQMILEKLNQIDILEYSDYESNMKPKKPIWYYLAKIKKNIKKRIPDDSNKIKF